MSGSIHYISLSAQGFAACRSCGYILPRHDERGGVGTKVEEEVGQTEAGGQTGSADDVKAEADDAEEHCQEDESDQLNWLAADGVNSGDRDPVSRYSTREHQDDVTDSYVLVVLVHVVATSVADLSQNRSSVKTDAVEGLGHD